ncbi:hypothetical protein OAS39_06590 [Pirellulales bacterium]|nr:hypothetical protein [Pirellulales bacterium]
MSEANQMGRDELKQIRPNVHLQPLGGFDNVAQPRDLAGNFATAACMTFEDAEVAPQELLTVYESIKQCLAMSDENVASEKLRQCADQAFDVAGSLLNKTVNKAIIAWVQECLPLVKTEKGISAFTQHLTSVVQQYSIIVSVKHRV